MNAILSDVETRVLGSLIEKDLTTPDYYLLSPNTLVHVCSQESNRDPLKNLDENAVRQAWHGLNETDAAMTAPGLGHVVAIREAVR